MYYPQDVAVRIKKYAKTKKIVIKEMLADCNLTVNTLANMRDGKAPSFSSLAKIADYLECSVDYLVGRTEISEVNGGQGTMVNDEKEMELIKMYRALSEQGCELVYTYALSRYDAEKESKL